MKNPPALRNLAKGICVLLTVSQAAVVAAQSSADPPKAPKAATVAASVPVFEDVTAAAGVNFQPHLSKEKKFILESVSGGVAIFDYDLDGRLDLYFVGSQTVDSARRKQPAPSALYRNETPPGEAMKFREVGASLGVDDTGWGVGVCAGDVDGDGFTDLYVTGVGGTRLFRNQAGKSFSDQTQAAGVGAPGWSTGCGFADADRDGDLDLFVARYLDMDLDNLPAFGRGELCQYRGIPVQCGPRGLPGQSDLYFRNRGDGTFEEVGEKAGLHDPEKKFGLGVTWFDADGDGWQDLYVANDTMQNFLYLNKKDGTFEEMSYLFGAAVSEDGKEQGSMGIAVGDYQNQGWPSLFVTNFSEEYNTLYSNQEGGFFTDASFRSGTAAASVRHVGWGTTFFDADNDGWLDLLLVNGHVYPQIDEINLEASAPYRQRRMLFRNQGGGRFDEVRTPKGPLAQETVSRGLAVGDLDNDGRLDLVISDLDGKAQVLRNQTPDSGHWLTVQLQGRDGMAEAIGARITVRSGKEQRQRWVLSGTSYLSQHAFRQHFGLGGNEKIDGIEVRWPDGTTSRHPGVAADQLVVIRQPGS